MKAEESFGAFSCDTGSGRLGETLQHDDIGVAPMLLGAAAAMLSIIAAIFGQCGSHGCTGSADPWVQQPAMATAGEASTPSNRRRATSLERIFTIRAVLRVCIGNRNDCDYRHKALYDWSLLLALLTSLHEGTGAWQLLLCFDADDIHQEQSVL